MGREFPPAFRAKSRSHFKPNQSQSGGAGIGLSIVHEIMAAHGGTLHITCRPLHRYFKCQSTKVSEMVTSLASQGIVSPIAANRQRILLWCTTDLMMW